MYGILLILENLNMEELLLLQEKANLYAGGVIVRSISSQVLEIIFHRVSSIDLILNINADIIRL